MERCKQSESTLVLEREHCQTRKNTTKYGENRRNQSANDANYEIVQSARLPETIDVIEVGVRVTVA